MIVSRQMSDRQGVANLVRKRPLPFLLAIICCAILLQAALVKYKTTISHDETISYLSANAHQGEFDRIFAEQLYPANQWVTAGEWKAWFALDQPLAFRQIGQDLAETDIHPPLYFWLLHLWVWLFGVHAWTGPTLNMLLQVVGAVALFKLAEAALKDKFEAVVVVFIWAVSPAVLNTVLEARQYTLFGTCAILFVWLIVRATAEAKMGSWQLWALLAMVTACGALTHYHFVLVVAGAGLVFGLKWLRREWQRVIWLGTAVFTGYLLSFALHPQFYQSIQELGRRQALEAQHLSGWLAVVQRIYAVSVTFTGFWTAVSAIQLLLFCLAVASLIWLGMVLWKNPARIRQKKAATPLQGIDVALFFIWMAGLGILLYLTFVSPIHAMSARHMSAAWPFFPFLLVLLLRLLPQPGRDRLLLALAVFVFLSSPLMVWRSAEAAAADPPPDWTSLNIDNVVADGAYQGIFPRLFLELPDDMLVFAASQNALIAQPDAWLPEMDETAVYVSDLSYDNTISHRDQILQILAQRFTVVPHAVDHWPIGDTYFLQPLP
ncbi:MAG: glycosyltransferase family 39 protein [Ardenticatenaceae bacterium]|nr:glycosyltransferase family 39 protein [Ardenticatenaceae bacterium]